METQSPLKSYVFWKWSRKWLKQKMKIKRCHFWCYGKAFQCQISLDDWWRKLAQTLKDPSNLYPSASVCLSDIPSGSVLRCPPWCVINASHSSPLQHNTHREYEQHLWVRRQLPGPLQQPLPHQSGATCGLQRDLRQGCSLQAWPLRCYQDAISRTVARGGWTFGTVSANVEKTMRTVVLIIVPEKVTF